MKDKINTFGKSMVFLIGIIAVSLFLAPFIRRNSEGFSGFLSPGYFLSRLIKLYWMNFLK